MPNKRMTAALVAAALTVGVGTAAVADPGGIRAGFPGASDCWLELRDAGPQAHLIAMAAPGVSGSYELTAGHGFRDRDMSLQQSGTFSAGHGATRLTRVMVGNLLEPVRRPAAFAGRMDPGTTVIGGSALKGNVEDFRARLTVRDRSGRIVCRTSRIHNWMKP